MFGRRKSPEEYKDPLPSWKFTVKGTAAGWEVVEGREHPALKDVDFFMPPAYTLDTLNYLEPDGGETPGETFARRFGPQE